MQAKSTTSFYRRGQLLEDSEREKNGIKLTPDKRKRMLWEHKLKEIGNLVQSFKDQPLPIERKSRISDPSSVYKIFPKQQQALDFSKSCEQDVTVFSKELDWDGKRNYLVTSTHEFWKMYKKLPAEKRHYYEVIPEGSPCRLYFDLEFKKEFNRKHNGEEMVEIFLKYICEELKTIYGISCDKRNVINMDSSTKDKFSVHLIFHLPNAVFKNNIHAGRFVEHACDNIHLKITAFKNLGNNCEANQSSDLEGCHSNIEEALELWKLLIKTSKGNEDIFCDRGVYTKNRNFRLYLSTKMGRNSPLVLARNNEFRPRLEKENVAYKLSANVEYLLFVDTLVSNFRLDSQCQMLTFDDVSSNSCPTMSTELHEAAPVEICQHSPYPEVDQFIKNNISKGGVQGYIRRCVYFKEGNIIIYDIGGNRWCDNIGRFHKSNHIMIVANLARGVYYQKCHDPECRRIDFKSPELPFPFEVDLVASKLFDDDDVLKCLNETLDNNLLSAIDEMEEKMIVEPLS